MDIALVRREDMHRDRTEQRIAGFLEHHRLADVVQSQPTELRRSMRREQTSLAAERYQLATERLGRSVRGLPGITFERNDLFADEVSRPLLQVLEFGREGEIHGAVLHPVVARTRRP